MARRFQPFHAPCTLTLAALLAACTAAPSTPVASSSSLGPSRVPSATETVSAVPSVTAPPTPFVVGSATMVTGTFRCAQTGTGTSWDDERGVGHGRDIPMACDETANDPRVSGREELTFNYDAFGDGGRILAVQWGTGRLENDGGAWQGRWTGVIFPGLRDDITLWYAGSGTYQGLIYYAHVTGSVGSYTVEGLIFEGSLPPGS